MYLSSKYSTLHEEMLHHYTQMQMDRLPESKVQSILQVLSTNNDVNSQKCDLSKFLEDRFIYSADTDNEPKYLIQFDVSQRKVDALFAKTMMKKGEYPRNITALDTTKLQYIGFMDKMPKGTENTPYVFKYIPVSKQMDVRKI